MPPDSNNINQFSFRCPPKFSNHVYWHWSHTEFMKRICWRLAGDWLKRNDMNYLFRAQDKGADPVFPMVSGDRNTNPLFSKSAWTRANQIRQLVCLWRRLCLLSLPLQFNRRQLIDQQWKWCIVELQLFVTVLRRLTNQKSMIGNCHLSGVWFYLLTRNHSSRIRTARLGTARTTVSVATSRCHSGAGPKWTNLNRSPVITNRCH